jgi:hypothetical protein
MDAFKNENSLTKLASIRNQLKDYFKKVNLNTQDYNEQFAFNLMFNFYNTIDNFLNLYINEDYLDLKK